MTREEFRAKAKWIIDNEPFDVFKLFEYENFAEMRIAYMPNDLGSAEADMPLEDFLDELYEQIKGNLKR